MGILTSRGVPAAAVDLPLGHVAVALRDFPRAVQALTLGRAALLTADGETVR